MSDNRMNPEVKALWLKALRSGKYQQGTGFLRVGDEFCCLGVLCDVAVKSGVEIRVNERILDLSTEYGEEAETELLPIEVIDWASVDGGNGVLPNGDELTDLNDAQGLTFDEIADLIETYL